VSIREGRKSRVESLSKTRRTPSRPVEAMLHRHLHRVKASKLPRRRFLHLAAGAATLPVVSRDARAQAYPTRPIAMIVPSAAGGATDVVARILAERMRRLLEKPSSLKMSAAQMVASGLVELPVRRRMVIQL
jgi:hypothetical protein